MFICFRAAVGETISISIRISIGEAGFGPSSADKTVWRNVSKLARKVQNCDQNYITNRLVYASSPNMSAISISVLMPNYLSMNWNARNEKNNEKYYGIH